MTALYISIRGARENNLKNISLDIPHNKLIVVTGVSGSGKSSLAYDVIFKESRRRYLESLSSQSRQYLAKIRKSQKRYSNAFVCYKKIKVLTKDNHEGIYQEMAIEANHQLQEIQLLIKAQKKLKALGGKPREEEH